jgi:hypothetical protein
MKTSLLIAAILAGSLATPVAYAQHKHVHEKAGTGMTMDQPMPQMQENMKQMQAQMEAFHATADPAERQKLMQAHMQAMQDGMQMMRGMDAPMKMGGADQGGMMKAGHKHMSEGEMMQQHAMMEQRMEMMQMMMQQMAQHGQAMEPMSANRPPSSGAGVTRGPISSPNY